MPAVPPFSDEHLEAICGVLAHTDTGLSGNEIGQILAACRVADPQQAGFSMTKRVRLFEALRRQQVSEPKIVLAFIKKSMAPVRYHADLTKFAQRRSDLNRALLFCGIELLEDGNLRQVRAASTVSEAHERASRLKATLEQRKVHPDVLAFCKAELLADNYFHAVLEATKSLAKKIREKTGLTSDGHQLVDQAFSLGSTGMPMLALNTLQTDTERNEHNGTVSLMKGVFSAFRNVTAHEARVSWPIPEEDALDLLSMVSLIHRRIDRAVRTTRT